VTSHVHLCLNDCVLHHWVVPEQILNSSAVETALTADLEPRLATQVVAMSCEASFLAEMYKSTCLNT